MAKQSVKPDVVLKNYWNDNARFADFFNAVLFQGENVIDPKDLEDVDTEESSVLEHRQYAESVTASRDSIKIQKKSTKHGVELVMLGLENQEHVHYGMPLRVMGYDYGTYRKQYESNAVKYTKTKDLTEDEFLSRMKKSDRFTPVITIVIYYGEKTWDAAVCLHDMLDIPDQMKLFVNDYKMLLVEVRKNNLKLHNIDNRDLFNLLDIFLNNQGNLKESREKAMQYAREHQVDKTVVMTVAGTANCSLDYEEINAKGGKRNMYAVFEETRREGMEQGLIRGRAFEIIETGKEFGFSQSETLERLQRKLNISKAQAQDYVREYKEETLDKSTQCSLEDI